MKSTLSNDFTNLASSLPNSDRVVLPVTNCFKPPDAPRLFANAENPSKAGNIPTDIDSRILLTDLTSVTSTPFIELINSTRSSANLSILLSPRNAPRNPPLFGIVLATFATFSRLDNIFVSTIVDKVSPTIKTSDGFIVPRPSIKPIKSSANLSILLSPRNAPRNPPLFGIVLAALATFSRLSAIGAKASRTSEVCAADSAVISANALINPWSCLPNTSIGFLPRDRNLVIPSKSAAPVRTNIALDSPSIPSKEDASISPIASAKPAKPLP